MGREVKNCSDFRILDGNVFVKVLVKVFPYPGSATDIYDP